MDLLLWRHAEAEDGFPDEARALTTKGRRQAERMARWLNRHLPHGARILVSPTRRTRETAEPLGRDVEVSPQVGTSTTAADLLDAAGWPDAGDDATVLVVGHQPTLGQVAAMLMTGQPAGWPVKKGAVWWFSSRMRHGHREVVLQAVVGADLV
ncbi:MAG: histidine phosphatase family protein [Betaproteobacteria bacterium]|nr:histidine phosphatase family protein [Betaproteobacteria bacterium]